MQKNRHHSESGFISRHVGEEEEVLQGREGVPTEEPPAEVASDPALEVVLDGVLAGQTPATQAAVSEALLEASARGPAIPDRAEGGNVDTWGHETSEGMEIPEDVRRGCLKSKRSM